ncbi:S-adenosyl-L-methionine-dependent methyltransferase [Lentinus tigrinus ALCF2SS1-7]|uniref:S-adenosyl-L-methionine-dependent methyltransferase n=1 Tax=Lentinus tigrinus ALCF2SS1-6 TaxID=1328759 RepID=A0A5C2S331_9APHY|nr:S-adenosyl-L-methionine-dependent methyltransferase [Lentinus tigrinus ALCF2SS1-6]RPD69009.1 S-adenosyl-L-methionine-dependent methyltransferase [Lentinus tigrinus ALCF2SS1-7]
MTFASLRALHALIGTAIDDMERVYHARSPNLDYPSIDKPYYKDAQHIPEEELSESLTSDETVAAAAKQIVAACGHLSHTVSKPWFGLVEDIHGGVTAECIRFMETANIVEILREAGPDGLHVDSLLKQILELRPKARNAPVGDGPLTPVNLGHILRLLATSQYLREVKPNVFANNRVSSYIDSCKSVAYLREAPDKKYTDTDGVAAFVGITGDEVIRFCACLTDWTLPDRTPTDAFDTLMLKKSSRERDEGKAKKTWAAPFNIAFNTQLGYFPWLELPGNESRLNRFGHGMTATRQWETKKFILQGFDWENLPEGSVLIDVGGGIGGTSIIVAEAHPHLRVVVEDREPVVSTAVSAWGPQYAQLFGSGRMSYRTRDFFQSWDPLTLPDGRTVDAPSVFMVRLILHDWADDDSRKILTRLRAAARPDTKLLVGDMLLPFACRDDASSSAEPSFAPSGSPLLPNLGKGNVHGYLLDIVMMGMFNAREKTTAEMSALLLSAGWKVTDIRRTPGNVWAYTTAVPV